MFVAFVITVALIAVFILLELLREKLKIDERYVLGIVIFLLSLVVVYIVWKVISAGLPRCFRC